MIARRARIVHDDRVRALETAQHEAGAESPSVEAIVTAFLGPLLRWLIGGDPGWRYTAASPRSSTCCTSSRAATCIAQGTAAIDLSRYMFLIGAVVQVMSATGRIERLSRGLCRSDDIPLALRELVPFVSAGLRALASPPR